jgi:PPOX class probable F420-dependent enzyme
MSLDLPTLDAFLAEPRNAIVIGVRRNGRPQSTPNWFLWEDGKFFISTTRTRAKYRIFRNDSRVQLVIDDPTGFRYVVVDGMASFGEDVDAGLDYSAASARSTAGRARPTRKSATRWSATSGCCWWSHRTFHPSSGTAGA